MLSALADMNHWNVSVCNFTWHWLITITMPLCANVVKCCLLFKRSRRKRLGTKIKEHMLFWTTLILILHMYVPLMQLTQDPRYFILITCKPCRKCYEYHLFIEWGIIAALLLKCTHPHFCCFYVPRVDGHRFSFVLLEVDIMSSC